METKILRILGNLPSDVREKAHAIQAEAEAASGAAKRAHDAMLAAQRDLKNAEGRLRDEDARRGPRMRRLANRSNPRLQAEARKIGDDLEQLRADWSGFEDEHRRRQFAYRAAQAEFNNRGNLWNRTAAYLDGLGNLHVAPVEPPKVTLRKGQTYVEAVDACRAKILEAKEHIEALKHAPVTVAEAVTRAKDYCRRLRESAEPDVDNFYRRDGDGPVEWPARLLHVYDVHNVQKTSTVRAPDPAAVLAWMFPEEFEAALLRTVEAAGDDADEQAPLEGRYDALRSMADDLERLEREEEALIEMAHRDGTPIQRRPDCRVEIVLGVAAGTPILEDAAA